MQPARYDAYRHSQFPLAVAVDQMNGWDRVGQQMV